MPLAAWKSRSSCWTRNGCSSIWLIAGILPGLVEQPLQVRDLEVADPDGRDPAVVAQRLHRLPRLGVAVGLRQRPVDEVEVQGLALQLVHRGVERLHRQVEAVRVVVELGGDPHVVAEAAVLDRLADPGLVAVHGGGVDVLVTDLEGLRHRGHDLVLRHLPDAEAQLGDRDRAGRGVQRDSGNCGHAFTVCRAVAGRAHRRLRSQARGQSGHEAFQSGLHRPARHDLGVRRIHLQHHPGRPGGGPQPGTDQGGRGDAGGRPGRRRARPAGRPAPCASSPTTIVELTLSRSAAGYETLCSRWVVSWLTSSQNSSCSIRVPASTAAASPRSPRRGAAAARRAAEALLAAQLDEDLLAGPEVADDVGLGQADGVGEVAQRDGAHAAAQSQVAGRFEDRLAPLLLVLRAGGPGRTGARNRSAPVLPFLLLAQRRCVSVPPIETERRCVNRETADDRNHRPAGGPPRPARRERRAHDAGARAAGQPPRRAARGPPPHRHEEGLQPGRVRCLHGPGRRPSAIVSCLALAVQYDGREVTTIEGVGPASAPGRVRPLRRPPVRVLHAGPDLLGHRHARRARPTARRARSTEDVAATNRR